MGVTKEDTAIALGLGLILLGGRKAAAASSGPSSARPPSPAGGAADAEDGAKLVARANQPQAQEWAAVFAAQKLHPRSGEALDMPPALAAALARWVGIESSGNPTIVSSAGERGLMQAGPQSVDEGALSPDQWEALVNPDTGNDAHAGIAMHYVDWLYGRAARLIKDPPSGALDQIWYAKLYHQRPVDVRDGKMHGAAIPMARELARRWARDPKAMHRLRAANVVAWGTPTP